MVLRYGKPEEAGMSARQIDKLGNMVKRWVDEGFSPSISYLVARNGIIAAHGAEGTHSKKDCIQLKPDSIFNIASITKSVTAVAIIILTEDGLLSPVTPVQEFLPEFTGESKDQVLIHHLLTHTSGLKDDDIWEYVDKNKELLEIPPCEAIEHPYLHKKLHMGIKAPLSYKIGSYMSYCNFGYELLGEIVRRVSGMSLDAFFSKRIFEPLELKDTYLIVPEEKWNRVVEYPEDCAAGNWPTTKESFNYPSAAGGLYSTVYDMAVFGQMLLNEGSYGDTRILSKAAVRSMVKNQTKGISSSWGDIRFPESGWGLGFMISVNKKDESGTFRSPEAYSHSGWGCTYLFVDPVYRTVITCFQVTTKIPSGRLNRRFDILTDVALAAIE